MTKITILNINDLNYLVFKTMLDKKFKLYYKIYLYTSLILPIVCLE